MKEYRSEELCWTHAKKRYCPGTKIPRCTAHVQKTCQCIKKHKETVLNADHPQPPWPKPLKTQPALRFGMCSLRTKSEMRRFFSQLCTILRVHLRFFHHFSSFFMATSRVDSSFCNTSNWIISSSHQQRICDPLKPLNPLVTIFF